MSPFFLAVAGAALLLGFLYVVKNRRSSSSKLPPSPPSLPLVGHLHLIGQLPHRSLHALHLRNGNDSGLLLLHLGRRRTLVASTAAAAADLFRNHDLAFSSRPHHAAAHKQTYGSRNISFSPYGDHWRRAKKIAVVHLLSQRRVEASAPARRAEAAALVARTRRAAAEAAEPVVVRDILYGYTNAVVTRVAFGAAGTTAERLRKLTAHSATLVAGFQADDVLPDAAARVFRRVTGLEKKIDKKMDDWDKFLTEIMAEHKEKTAGPGHGGGGDFLDVLLKLRQEDQEEGAQGLVLSDDGIKAIAKDMIGAATDTTAVTLEWAMVELICNPRVMSKVQDEVTRVAEQPEIITDAELSRMGYLRAVVKEVLRLHPPLPLLLPRESMSPAAVLGGRYEIPAKTTLMVNAWAIGRDPAAWDEPEEFRPERFMAQQVVEPRGTDYQLLPFGAGRRVCPGIGFALPVVELALASLLRHFDWELPAGVRPADLDMVEAPGLSAPPRVPLVLVPKWKALA